MNFFKRSWQFLKEDSWQSWIVSLVLMYLVIKYVLFPVFSLVFGTPLPLVVVESCSMYHETDYDSWWGQNSLWYGSVRNISGEQFDSFPFKNGLNKGDIVFLYGKSDYKLGDIIVFRSNYTYPLIHRVVSLVPLATKGDHNPGHLSEELNIDRSMVLGHAVLRIPALGWFKLIFFEGFKPRESRGFCR